jgi:hypothetical protein
MNKKVLMYIRVLDQCGAILYEGLPVKLPFPDEVIVSKSILYFNDPHPCIIHRNAVAMRLAAELQQALENGPISPFMGPWACYFAAFPDACRVEGFYP